MNKRTTGIFVTLKSKLYLSLFILVLLFIVNGIITLVVLNNNKALSNQVTSIIDPATHSLTEFNKLIIESKMFLILVFNSGISFLIISQTILESMPKYS